MSDNIPAPAAIFRSSLLLPCVSLALTVAAFSLGAPARIARCVHRGTSPVAHLETDTTIRYEPVVSPKPVISRHVGTLRGFHEVLGRQFVALR